MQVEEHYVELILSEREIMKLSDIGFSYETLIDDMTKYYQERSRRTDQEMKDLGREMKKKYRTGGFGFGSMAGFYTFNEVVAELDSMRMLYPNLITAKFSIGTTFEGRTIWAAKISDNPDVNEEEPAILLNSLTHPNEPQSMMTVVYFMYYLLENYGSDPEITHLIDNREFYFVPVICADGYEYIRQNEPNGRMWRKNRKDNGNGCFGVNGNMNYGYMWGYNDIGSSPDPCSDKYRGSGPFSESETQAIRDLCIEHNFIFSNNYHSYGNVVFPPWAYNLTQTVDSSVFNNLIRLGTQLNHYDLGTPDWPGIPQVNGESADWMYGDQISKPKIFAVDTEVGNAVDGQWPPPERIFPLAQENVYLNKVLAWGPGVIDNPPNINEGSLYSSYCAPSVDSIRITAFESNPENYNSVVTAFLYDLNDNLIDEFEMNEISTNNFYASYLAPQEENFYYLLLKDEGVEIPSNFYYKKNLRFTTAGPVVLDSIWCVKLSVPPRAYSVRPFVKNLSTGTTITSASVKLICNDPWITSITPTSRPLPNIPPGERVGPSSAFTVRYIDSLFSGEFNFKIKVMSDNWPYWTDSVQVVVGVEKEDFQILTYKLEQNYPNPFNPSTKIKYSVPQSSTVIIKIFDILGNEIETLVNEEKQAGTYEITWYAVNLPSGVYFYQLKAGDFVQTKKMVLMK
jgi:hypothetical protein